MPNFQPRPQVMKLYYLDHLGLDAWLFPHDASCERLWIPLEFIPVSCNFKFWWWMISLRDCSAVQWLRQGSWIGSYAVRLYWTCEKQAMRPATWPFSLLSITYSLSETCIHLGESIERTSVEWADDILMLTILIIILVLECDFQPNQITVLGDSAIR